MATQSREQESESPGGASTPGAKATEHPAERAGSANQLQRYLKLLSATGLYGNGAGQSRMGELAQGAVTPRIQSTSELKAALERSAAEEDAAASATAGGSAWWEDPVCADEEGAQPEEETDEADTDEVEAPGPDRAEFAPIFPPPVIPPPVVPPVVPEVVDGLLERLLMAAGRRLMPVVLGMWPKDTAGPELDQWPAPGLEPGLAPGLALRPDEGACVPRPVPRRGGDMVHDSCADWVTDPEYRGKDVLVGGKAFDGINQVPRVLWEIKTNNFDNKSPKSQEFFAERDKEEFEREAEIARLCEYEFRIGVSDSQHAKQIEKFTNGIYEIIHLLECRGERE